MEWMIGLKRYSVMKITNLHYQGDAIPWEEKKKNLSRVGCQKDQVTWQELTDV